MNNWVSKSDENLVSNIENIYFIVNVEGVKIVKDLKAPNCKNQDVLSINQLES